MILPCGLLVMFLSAPVDYTGKVNCPEPAVAPDADGITPPRAKHKSPARYPAVPKRIHKLSAVVILRGTIDVDGNVGDIDAVTCRVKKGDKVLPKEDQKEPCVDFTASARFAFTDWQYEPAMRGDAPVCVRWVVKFVFSPRK